MFILQVEWRQGVLKEKTGSVSLENHVRYRRCREFFSKSSLTIVVQNMSFDLTFECAPDFSHKILFATSLRPAGTTEEVGPEGCSRRKAGGRNIPRSPRLLPVTTNLNQPME
ncbi:hypothetical protein AU381_18545 [Sinorhizobium glycinis]|uniref:Uncharacterized protein n=1 Tax=Sinorhizobium glycinis TaxID=1472378 RepID=A0A178XP37_9HYPH|nr:hypothetical protein AU381_18545 [Sinorhizobium glycinis]